MLHINKQETARTLHNMAVANHVTDEQMASFIFRNFYTAREHVEKDQKIRRFAVAIANLTRR